MTTLDEVQLLLTNRAQNDFRAKLSNIAGEKVLCIAETLYPIVNKLYFTIIATDEKHNYHLKKIIKFQQREQLQQIDHMKTLVFFVPSDPAIFKQICTQISRETNAGQLHTRKYAILVLPKLSILCDNMLEEYGCYGNVEVHEVPLCMIPLDNDLYSSEQTDYLPKLFMDQDLSPLRNIARGLLNLESHFGRPDQIVCFGEKSGKVKNLRNRLIEADKEMNDSRDFDILGQESFSKLIIFDREVDYITPLVSCDTVEAMLDETFGMNAGRVILPGSLINQPKNFNFDCTHSNEVFSTIRDMHLMFEAVPELTNIQKRITELHTSLNKADTATIRGYLDTTSGISMHQVNSQKLDTAKKIFAAVEYMQKLREAEDLSDLESDKDNLFTMHQPRLILKPNMKEYRDLQNTILQAASEARTEILKTLEEFILRQVKPEMVLRYLCLFSVCSSGLLENDYNHMKSRFINNYGRDYLSTWFKLNKIGLLIVRKSALFSGGQGSVQSAVSRLMEDGAAQKLIKELKLTPCLENFGKDTLARGTSGLYIPLSVKLIEKVVQDKPFEDKIKSLIPGQILAPVNAVKSAKSGTMKSVKAKIEKEIGKKLLASKSGKVIEEKLVILYVLGGITYQEISAFRLLGRNNNVKFIFCTDGVINGDRLVNQFMQPYVKSS